MQCRCSSAWLKDTGNLAHATVADPSIARALGSVDIPVPIWRGVPLKRTGEPEDFAEVMLFLCAGAAYITGETIVVYSGETI